MSPPTDGGGPEPEPETAETKLPAAVTRSIADTSRERETLAEQVRARRAAAQRLPPLPCGHNDPIECLAGHRRSGRR